MRYLVRQTLEQVPIIYNLGKNLYYFGVKIGNQLEDSLQKAAPVFYDKIKEKQASDRDRKIKNLASTHPCKVVIGTSIFENKGWIKTEQEFLDLLIPEDWKKYFTPGSIDAIKAEHVWEHLTDHEALVAAKICFDYLKWGGYLRVAVPDGYHPNPDYINKVSVEGDPAHKVLYTYKTLSSVFEQAGFNVELYEYFDETGKFHYHKWDPNNGTIRRSSKFDQRNKNGELNYTSIILDAKKEKKEKAA